ncbi:MAG: phosphotransferase [Chloroflexi bacterium]|nr:phosphotransferase [Chloroflexota bacterium]
MSQRDFSLTPTQQQGLAVLLADAAAIITPFLSVPVEAIKGYERLAHKPKFWVGRLRLTDTPTPFSVIVKHVPPEHYPAEPAQIAPDLRDEQLAYQFLNALPEFDRLPHLFGQKPGLLVLEDLEPMRVNLPSDVWLTQLADTLARLHGVCGRERTLYTRLRQEAGLGHYPGVGYPSANLWFGFLEGIRELKSWCDLLALPTPDWATLIQTARTTLQAEGPFMTLIHTELASARNAIATRHGVCLVDFEGACFGHALIDVAVAMIGRIEWQVSGQGYFLNHLPSEMTFADLYRQKWESWRGERVADEQWQKELATALIFVAGLAVGSARQADAKYAAVQPLGETLGEILRRLTGFLDPLNCFSELSSSLRTLHEGWAGLTP